MSETAEGIAVALSVAAHVTLVSLTVATRPRFVSRMGWWLILLAFVAMVARRLLALLPATPLLVSLEDVYVPSLVSVALCIGVAVHICAMRANRRAQLEALTERIEGAKHRADLSPEDAAHVVNALYQEVTGEHVRDADA